MPRVQGHQKWYSGLSDIQIHKYKFTKPQIQPVMKCRKYPTCIIFLKSQRFKDIKHDILDCQIHKYTNTNAQIQKYKFTKTQIHKYSIWQNDRNTQHMLYFWIAGVKNDNLKCSDPRYTVEFCTVPPGLFIRALEVTFLVPYYAEMTIFRCQKLALGCLNENSRTSPKWLELALVLSVYHLWVGFQQIY